jgi:hypothetical protein
VATIGILWCTYFDRGGKEDRSLRIVEAYRPPSLFAHLMRKKSHTIELLYCDEQLKVTDLNGGTARIHDDVEILYVTTHGAFSSTAGHEISLNTTTWFVNRLGHNKLSVAIFDTCSMIDGTAAWRAGWTAANLGTNLRLLLGFDGLSSLDRGLALRGQAFAENLDNGDTFADAWIKAVRSTTVRGVSMKPVAIGIGESHADAKNAVDKMSLSNMLGARDPTKPTEFVEKY